MVQLVQFVLYQQIKGSFMKIKLFIFLAILFISSTTFAQRPPRGDDRPQKGRPPMREGERERREDGNRQPDWVKIIDTNDNKKIERDEYKAASAIFFAEIDVNNNGILEQNELPMPPQRNQQHLLPPHKKGVPPNLFLERGDFNLTKEQFDDITNLRFITFDVDGDGVLDNEEIKATRPPDKPPMPNVAMAEFIGAEMRFGDKIVKGVPFSAETIREENKRLFDGSIIKNQSKGLIFRDGFGRTRQEQPLEKIGGFAVLGDNNQPKRLVHIFDVVTGKFFSLSVEEKYAIVVPFLKNAPQMLINEPKDGKKESLGNKKIEGVMASGTKITHEIPIGQIGNDKPIFIVTEKWFSDDLQMIIESKHSDPFIGEVVFKLVNIKLGEPSDDLFKVPSDYKILDRPEKKRP
jgi:hypothetical protein